MKLRLLVFILALACVPAFAQHHHNPVPPSEQPARLIADLGSFRFPTSSASADAQKFFDQGVILVYGFNHDEAARSFHACELRARGMKVLLDECAPRVVKKLLSQYYISTV